MSPDVSPNQGSVVLVVDDEAAIADAEVLYLIRAPRLPEVAEIYERINNIARGAALMTGTEVDILFDKACSNYIPNRVLGQIAYDNFLEVGPPPNG